VTTSQETDALHHPILRELVERTNALPLPDRVVLLEALVPAVARDMTPLEYESLVTELRLKASVCTTPWRISAKGGRPGM
jgi:hypothetical protein